MIRPTRHHAPLSPHALGPDDVRRFHEDGFLSPLRLWAPEETPKIRELIERHYLPDGLDGPPASKTSFARAPELIELFRRPTLTGPIASILGEDLFLWRVKAFNKRASDARAKEVPWHQDRYSWPLEPMVACSAWLAIDDALLDNACVHVIPGSHRRIVPHIPATDDQLFDEQADPAHFDPGEARPLVLRAGEFALFNERLLHWSDVNRSGRRRLGLAIRVLPAIVRVMQFDSDDHALVRIHGQDRLGFNRLVEHEDRSRAA